MKKPKGRYSWAVKITIMTFILSVTISVTTNIMLEKVNLAAAFLMLGIVVAMGIVFDIVGIAVTSASETPFHARSAKGVKGSRESIALIRSAEKVSNFCNDVVGDTVGVISGGLASAIVALIIAEYKNLNVVVLNLVLAGIVAAVTVGGKAMGKGIAIGKSDVIIARVGIILYYFKRIFTFGFAGKKNKKRDF